MNSRTRLDRWSDLNAILILAAGATAYFLGRPRIALLGVAISFPLLFVRMRGRWTPGRGFGFANLITLSRLMGICVLFFCVSLLPEFGFPAAAALLLFMDGLDGWAARRLGEVSDFGAHFDMETDAVFIYLLALAAVITGRLPPVLLIIGLLRYALVLFRMFMRSPLFARRTAMDSGGGERRGKFGRFVFLITAAALLYAVLPGALFAAPVAAVALVLLCISFAEDFRRAWRERGSISENRNG